MACPGPEFSGRYESLSAASSLNNRLKSGRCRRFRRRPTAPGDHQSGLVLKRSLARAAWPSLTDGRSKWSRSLPLRARSFFFKMFFRELQKIVLYNFFFPRSERFCGWCIPINQTRLASLIRILLGISFSLKVLNV